MSHINKVTIKAVYRYHMRGMYYKLYAFYIKYINLYTFIFIYIYKLSGFIAKTWPLYSSKDLALLTGNIME